MTNLITFLHLCSGIYAECEKNKTSIAGERLHDFKIQVSRNYDPQRTNANDIDSWDTCYHEKGRSNYVAESSYYDSGIRLSLKFSTSFLRISEKVSSSDTLLAVSVKMKSTTSATGLLED